jgi:hypothetical protein
MCQTALGWYCTPNVTAITCVTRAKVHNGVRLKKVALCQSLSF